MTGPGSSNLYRSYRAADNAYHDHYSACARCEGVTHCPDGQRLYKRFADLQDDYLNLLRKRDRR